jgi:hypothetical protein
MNGSVVRDNSPFEACCGFLWRRGLAREEKRREERKEEKQSEPMRSILYGHSPIDLSSLQQCRPSLITFHPQGVGVIRGRERGEWLRLESA